MTLKEYYLRHPNGSKPHLKLSLTVGLSTTHRTGALLARIRDTIVGPSHPGAHYALVTLALHLGLTADRVLFPQDLLEDDPELFEAVLKIARKYVDIHEGETLHVLANPHHTPTMARLMADVRRNGLRPGGTLKVRTEFAELPLLDFPVTHTVWACGDGRPWFWRSLIELFRHLGSPRIITPPGEEQWLLNNRGLAGRIEEWLDQKPWVPRVVVKHAGCGYRAFKGKPKEEREAALAECCDQKTLYLWQAGEGTAWFEVLRPPLREPC